MCLGESIYSGPCCFVLTKDQNQRYPTCWSVSDGNDASTVDIWNPIRSIYLLANEENVRLIARKVIAFRLFFFYYIRFGQIFKNKIYHRECSSMYQIRNSGDHFLIIHLNVKVQIGCPFSPMIYIMK